MTRKRVDILLLAAVLIGGFFVVRNAVAISDWWFFQRYEPPKGVAELADAAGMSDKGRHLFYRFSPQLMNQSGIDQQCSDHKLGCIEGRSIYILEPSGQDEFESATVTAAHEMLHVAYSRLSESKKQELQDTFSRQLQHPLASEVAQKLENYSKVDYFNEAHSFLGTEVHQLSAELEDYYQQYFDDRSKVLDAYSTSPEG